jgi:hypothetical protein
MDTVLAVEGREYGKQLSEISKENGMNSMNVEGRTVSLSYEKVK